MTMNKKHNRKLRRLCPVCGGKVLMAKHGDDWWVFCGGNENGEKNKHIPQVLYPSPKEAIDRWNGNIA